MPWSGRIGLKCATEWLTYSLAAWNRRYTKGRRAHGLADLYIQSHSARARNRIRASPLLSFAPIARLENRVYVTYTGTLRHGNHPVISLIQMSRRRKKNNSPFSRFSPPSLHTANTYCPLVSGEIAFDSWLFMCLAFHFDVCFFFFFFTVNLQKGYIAFFEIACF